MRLGLKIISGDFEEDLTKIVGGVSFQKFFDKTGNNRKSIQPKIGAIERRIRLIQGIQWYLIFENRSNGSIVTVLTKVNF